MKKQFEKGKKDAKIAEKKSNAEVIPISQTAGSLFGLPIAEPLSHLRGQYPFPARLNEHHVRRFGSSNAARHHMIGTLLFEEGATPDGVYVIVEGLVKLSINSAQGRAMVLGFFGSGTVLGLAAAILGNTHVSTAEIIQRTSAVFVPRKKLLEELRTQPLAALHVAQLVSEHNYFLMAKIAQVELSEGAEQKLARCLLGLFNNNSRGNRANVKSNVSQEIIAQMVGLSRETVSRLLSRLRRKGVLDWKRSDFIIRNRTALEKLADIPDPPSNS
ncbi:MAG TPA: Crp/Fnr family transcriptional regulator [Candidatus Dormibacteraeota bacterium]|nr:Crp/Fnr family transcriptional regulator [Candidatus Dormibacteraeota bacterium]